MNVQNIATRFKPRCSCGTWPAHWKHVTRNPTVLFCSVFGCWEDATEVVVSHVG